MRHGSSLGGSPSGGGASSPSHSPKAKEGIDAYALEKKHMRVKTYESLKLPTLPKNASEARTFKNGMFNVICKLANADMMSIRVVYKQFHKQQGQQTQTSELCKRSEGQGHMGKHSVSQRQMQRPN